MISFSSNWIVFFPIAFSLFVAMRLAGGRVDDGRQSIGLLAARSLVFMLFAFSLLAAGLRVSLMSLIWCVFVAALVVVLHLKNRKLERSAVLMTALSTDDLPQRQLLTRALANENTGWAGRKGAALVRDLARGADWGTALEYRGIAKGVYEKLAVRLDKRYGKHQPGQAERNGPEAVEPMQIEAEAERTIGRLMMFSWCVVVVPVVALIMTFIVPTFEEMFEEFGLDLPTTMSLVISVSDVVTSFGVVSLLGLSVIQVGLFLCIGTCALLWLFPRLTLVPPIRWLCRDYYRNVGFAALSHAIGQERDLIDACRATAELVPVTHISDRYRTASELLIGGATPVGAFVSAGLLSGREAQAVGTCFESRDLAWGLKQLASWKVAGMLRWYASVVQVLVVSLTLLVAVVVGALSIGVIQTLSEMISALS